LVGLFICIFHKSYIFDTMKLITKITTAALVGVYFLKGFEADEGAATEGTWGKKDAEPVPTEAVPKHLQGRKEYFIKGLKQAEEDDKKAAEEYEAVLEEDPEEAAEWEFDPSYHVNEFYEDYYDYYEDDYDEWEFRCDKDHHCKHRGTEAPHIVDWADYLDDHDEAWGDCCCRNLKTPEKTFDHHCNHEEWLLEHPNARSGKFKKMDEFDWEFENGCCCHAMWNLYDGYSFMEHCHETEPEYPEELPEKHKKAWDLCCEYVHDMREPHDEL